MRRIIAGLVQAGALAQCSTAIAERRRVSVFLDSRAMVLTRPGHFRPAIVSCAGVQRSAAEWPAPPDGRTICGLREGETRLGEVDIPLPELFSLQRVAASAHCGHRR